MCWKDCSFIQYYGFHHVSNETVIEYDNDCFDLPYILSSSMTAFETKFLKTLLISADIFLEQISYKQKAEINIQLPTWV